MYTLSFSVGPPPDLRPSVDFPNLSCEVTIPADIPSCLGSTKWIPSLPPSPCSFHAYPHHLIDALPHLRISASLLIFYTQHPNSISILCSLLLCTWNTQQLSTLTSHCSLVQFILLSLNGDWQGRKRAIAV